MLPFVHSELDIRERETEKKATDHLLN